MTAPASSRCSATSSKPSAAVRKRSDTSPSRNVRYGTSVVMRASLPGRASGAAPACAIRARRRAGGSDGRGGETQPRDLQQRERREAEHRQQRLLERGGGAAVVAEDDAGGQDRERAGEE